MNLKKVTVSALTLCSIAALTCLNFVLYVPKDHDIPCYPLKLYEIIISGELFGFTEYFYITLVLCITSLLIGAAYIAFSLNQKKKISIYLIYLSTIMSFGLILYELLEKWSVNYLADNYFSVFFFLARDGFYLSLLFNVLLIVSYKLDSNKFDEFSIDKVEKFTGYIIKIIISKKRLSFNSTLIGLILCLMPFATVKCNETKIVSSSTIDFALGLSPHMCVDSDKYQRELNQLSDDGFSIPLLLAVFLLVVSIILTYKPDQRRNLINIALFSSIILLLAGAYQISSSFDEAEIDYKTFVKVEFGVGFYGPILMSLLALGFLNFPNLTLRIKNEVQ
jgi:hypothetical protein